MFKTRQNNRRATKTIIVYIIRSSILYIGQINSGAREETVDLYFLLFETKFHRLTSRFPKTFQLYILQNRLYCGAPSPKPQLPILKERFPAIGSWFRDSPRLGILGSMGFYLHCLRYINILDFSIYIRLSKYLQQQLLNLFYLVSQPRNIK